MRQQRGLRAQFAVLAGLAALCALVAAADGGASVSRASIIFTVTEARGAMAQYHPSASMATKLPPGIGWVDVGGGCKTLGPGAPACYARMEYNNRRTGGRTAFIAAFYAGHVKTKVVKALLAHDGRFGSQTTFTAGAYSGIRERQWNKAFAVGGFDTYVWESKANTYMIQLHFTNTGAVDYPGFVPKSVIASYRPVLG
jgi:hypothetical protein